MRRVFRLPPGQASIARELDDELAFHIETRTQRLIADGMPPDAARAEAMRQFGDIDAVRHDCLTLDHQRERAMRRANMIDEMRQDLGYAVRALRHNRGFALTVILTLALGLGVNMAMFSFLDVVFLRPPAGVAAPEQVRRVWTEINFTTGAQFWSGFSYPQYAALQATLRDRVSTALYGGPEGMWVGKGQQEAKARVSHATASYFELLGVRAARGRFFSSDEDRLGAGSPVVVASHRFWREQLGGDPEALGREIHIASKPYTLIGVAAEGFTGVELDATDLWVPLSMYPGYGGQWYTRHSVNGFQILLRPRGLIGDDALIQRAAAGLRSPAARRVPGDSASVVRVGSIIRAQGPGDKSQEVKLALRLAGVTIIVLLIAGANVVNLLLARAVHRRREIAVRLAMGISRSRLARLLLTESVLLALLAAGAAVLAAYWGGELLRSLLMPGVTWGDGASTVHSRVIALAIGTGLIAGIIAGLLPAGQAARVELVSALKAGSGSVDPSAGRSRLRSALVVVQAALSVVLLVGAALFVSSLGNVRGLRTGYDAARIVAAGVQFDLADPTRAQRMPQMLRDLAERMRGAPGVESVALSRMAPTRGFSSLTFHPDVDTTRFPKPPATYNLVSPEFLAVTGTRVVRGRDFPRGMGASMPSVVVVNEAMARAQWPNLDAIGRCLRFAVGGECHTVIGVAENAMFDELLEDPQPQYYLPLDNPPDSAGTWFSSIIVRTAGTHGARDIAITELQRTIREMFPGGRPTIATMEQYLEPQYRPWRMGATLFTAFGVLALIVAALGIYSTIAYMVVQRTHEFGVRTALGARTPDILRQVIGTSLRTAAVGVAAGVVMAIIGGRFIAALLYGVKPGDPMIIVSVAIALLFVAAAAALGPAWRAARVDPVTALRVE